MTTGRTALFVLLALVLSGAAGCSRGARDGEAGRRGAAPFVDVGGGTPPPATTRPLATPPIGALGLPLGTVARVRATVVSGEELRDKSHASEYVLRVTHVNGTELAEKPLCDFGVPAYLRKGLARTPHELYEMKHGRKAEELTSEQVRRLERGYVGKEFVLDAYETGSFGGIPKNMPDDVPLWQDRGFGFRTALVVVAER